MRSTANVPVCLFGPEQCRSWKNRAVPLHPLQADGVGTGPGSGCCRVPTALPSQHAWVQVFSLLIIQRKLYLHTAAVGGAGPAGGTGRQVRTGLYFFPGVWPEPLRAPVVPL